MLRNTSLFLVAIALCLNSLAQTTTDTAKAVASTSAASSPTPASASSPAPVTAPPAVSITGSADIYYRYDFNRPVSAPFNSYTSFTQTHNQPQLGMATIKVEHKTAKVDLV